MANGKNILLYEPEDAVRGALAEALGAIGFNVTPVTKIPTVLPEGAWLVAGGNDPLTFTAMLRERSGEKSGATESFQAPCFHLLPANESSDGSVYGIQKPFRLYDFAAQMLRLTSAPRDVSVGPHRLSPNRRQLHFADGPKRDQVLALTEKEVAILLCLAESKTPVPRDELLHKVWGYHPDATTHTLETHIYRLRQKIEDNPDQPQLLVTKDAGYHIA